jgi:two-component system response regulator DesR
MVALTLAVAAISPVFTSLGSVGAPARAPYGPAVCGAALAALQVRTSYAASRGERPRWAWPTLLVMAALVYVPMHWYTWNWAGTQSMLGASALMLVPRRRLAVALAAAPVIGTLASSARGSLVSDPETSTASLVFLLEWWGIGLTCGITTLYGAARLVRVAGELQDARTELAELAIMRERLRVSRDLHDLAGQSLTAISLRGDLALALLEQDRDAARAEMATLTATARNALHDVLTVTRDGAAVDLRAEAQGARALLVAAGIETVVRLGDEADVAVLDIGLPGLDGLTAAERLHEELPQCRVVVLTGMSQPGNLLRALKVHVRGFIPKDAPARTLADGIRRVAAGERVIDPGMVAAALETGASPLTAREADVLRAAEQGLSTDAIGLRLSLASTTVRNYLSNAIAKTGGRNRLDAIRIARDAGWL